MSERLANLGYLALKKESAKGTAVTPNVYVPLYATDLTTKTNLDETGPVMGHKLAVHAVRQGQRSHGGDVTVLGEPNTAGYFFDMLLKKGSTTGSGPYTHPFTLSASADPNSYTVDIARGMHVHRYMGVEATKIEPSFEKNEMRLTVSLSGLKSFISRTVSAKSGTGPSQITLDTDYDPSPTAGLVANDIVQLYDVSAGVYINGTVASVDSVTQFTVTEDWSTAAAGDIVSLRKATPSFTLLTPFLWSQSEFRFGADASAAASATHLAVEQGSMWTVEHSLNDDNGEQRSGSFDPASLARKTGGGALKVKRFFDDPQDLNRFLAASKRACVIKHFSQGSSYELRVTFNNLRIKEGGDPAMEAGNLIYQELNLVPTYDTSDGQGMDVKVLNGVSSI